MRKPVTISLDDELLKKIDSSRGRVSRSRVIESIINKLFFFEDGKQKPTPTIRQEIIIGVGTK
jgi:metal-responsive CopG/Arc/MetJ family transcriptional regulator